MKKFICTISIFFLISFGCYTQSNKLFLANQTTLTSNTFKEIVENKVLLSECYLTNSSPKLMEIYFFNVHKDKSKISVRFNILGYFETDYKYFGYYIINKTIFFIKGSVPKGLFIRTKFIKKFVYVDKSKYNDVGSNPSWNFSYNNKKLSFIWTECGE